MAENDNQAHVQPLEEHEFLALLLVAYALLARERNPHADKIEFTLADVDYNPSSLPIVIDAHLQAAGSESPTTAGLTATMSKLATHIATTDVVSDPELRQLYIAVLCDALAYRNHHFLHWDDPDTYPEAVDSARDTCDLGVFTNWFVVHLSARTGTPRKAFILGAMTDADDVQIAAVRRRACRLKQVLERHGFQVHAPCAKEPAERSDYDVVEDDVAHIAEADLIIALLDPPALGVGIMLGEAARSRPAVIFVAEVLTDISPLAAIVGDPDPVHITYDVTDAVMIAQVERAIEQRQAFIAERADQRVAHARRALESFDEYSQAHQYALDNGLDLQVPGHPAYRVRLICTRPDSFRTATQEELEDICRAINDLLYGPDEPEQDNRERPDGYRRDGGPADPGYEDAGDQHEDDDEGDRTRTIGGSDPDDEAAEWDQPALFPAFTRHVDGTGEQRPPRWREVNPLTPDELASAHTARPFLHLSDSEFERMIFEAEIVRYREALAGAGASRAHFGDVPAWVRFWRHDLGRP